MEFVVAKEKDLERMCEITKMAKNQLKKMGLDQWQKGYPSREVWIQDIEDGCAYLAVEDGQIVGFGDMDDTGYLDRLYVHAKYQGRGIASAICDRLERKWLEQKSAGKPVSKKIITHASITARPFFEKRGYRVVKEQQVTRQGVLLINYVMEKE